jgi:hypothetical protein
MPGICAFEMRRQEKYAGFYFCLIWFTENLLKVARYMADANAKALTLPLVGGLDPEEFHDWTRILGHWGLLSWGTRVANCLRLLAFGLMAWTLWRSWSRSQAEA